MAAEVTAKVTAEESVKASSAMFMVLRHAFSVLAQQPCIDRNLLLDGLRSLSPDKGKDKDASFRTNYEACRDKLLAQIEGLYQEQPS
jgi:hypothetical protein